MSAERICAVLALGLAAAILAGSRGLTFMVHGAPGPGMMPRLIAAGLIAVCALLLLMSKSRSDRSGATLGSGINGRVAGAIAIMLLYAALMPVIGFPLATLLFILILNHWWGRSRWWSALTFSILSAAALYLIFRVLLDMPLPRGAWMD
jgi:hypothetical protein